MRTLVALATIAAAAAACTAGPRRDPAARPNILLVTIDTFRADRLNAGVTPHLAQLAASGIRFTAARSTVPLTLPSHVSILTGLLPPAHGVRENGTDALDARHATVARLLKSAGYETAAFVGAFVLDRRFGLALGFDTYDDRIPRAPNASERLEAERPASSVVDAALTWLDANHPQLFFVWIHLYDPHAPYDPPAEFVRSTSSQQPVASRYDGEVSYADAQLARVFDRLRDRGLLARTLVVVAGDHGEGLGDHGERTHGMLLYDSTLRVPLVVAGPGITAGVQDQTISLVDIAPTILNSAGVSVPGEMTGHDLVRQTVRLKADTTTNERSVRLQPDDVYSETQYPRVAGWSPLHALTDGRWKTIRAGSASELYDLGSDPQETHDLAGTQSATVAAMAARLDTVARSGSSAPRTIAPEAQERLRSLGYVASSAPLTAGSSARNPATTITAWNTFEEALTLLNAHRPDAAPKLERLAAENPDAPVFQSTYARALKETGRVREALDVYRRSAHRWPTDAMLLHDLAVAARDAAQSGNPSQADALRREAADAERAALTLSPSSAVAQNGLGLVSADQGRFADASAAFERATALDPQNPSYFANLGNAKRGAGDAAAAEQAYRRALELDSQSVDAANGLGVLLVERQRPSEAVQWFERALAAAPDFVEAQLNLAIARQQSGDSRGAADLYRRVIAARGDHPREKEAARKLLQSLAAAR